MSQQPDVPMAQLRPMNRKPRKAKVVKATPVPWSVQQEPGYACPELGRTCNRPNAYDAYDLPSLYGEVRRPYRFSQEM